MGLHDSTKFKYILAIISLIILFVIIKIYRTSTTREPSDYEIPKPKPVSTKPPKLILFYNTIWGSRLWPNMETTERFGNWGGRPYPVQN